MPRLPHGTTITESALRQAHQDVVFEAVNALAFTAAPSADLQDFDYLFPDLQEDPDALLPTSEETVKALKKLAEAMGDADETGPGHNSTIPAAYTYFGQFVDHDITLEVLSGAASEGPGGVLSPDLKPMALQDVRTTIRNGRTATLDLDSVYGGNAVIAPGNDQKLKVGDVSDAGDNVAPFAPVPGKGADNDVPRLGPNPNDPSTDRAAQLGDDRNDENLIISQLQVAFLKAHNRLVDLGYTRDQARRILRQHYQQVVVHDFLAKRVADEAIVKRVVTDGNRFFDALADPFFMPLEFSVAAYRFGHTMVRNTYDFNVNFNVSDGGVPASLELLFTFTALSGQLGFGNGAKTLPDNWVIQWENIVGDAIREHGLARRLDTRLSTKTSDADPGTALFRLRKVDGTPEDGLARMLSARNLLRGYRLRIPTGQAVAARLGLTPLTKQQLLGAVSQTQADALVSGGFVDRTPLWFYVLAEASHHGGNHLGPVGSTIVAEVLVGLVRRSEDSVLRVPGWRPALPAQTPGSYTLADLLHFAGVLGTPPQLTVHVVKAGDSLFAIAKNHLGDGNRWPEIFAANRTIVRRPDQIVPGMRLIVPTGPAPAKQQKFVVVKSGDTLSKLAKDHLGNANRWPEIFKANGAVVTNPDVIVVGQVLLIPNT
jgi:LysM repeat protein